MADDYFIVPNNWANSFLQAAKYALMTRCGVSHPTPEQAAAHEKELVLANRLEETPREADESRPFTAAWQMIRSGVRLKDPGCLVAAAPVKEAKPAVIAPLAPPASSDPARPAEPVKPKEPKKPTEPIKPKKPKPLKNRESVRPPKEEKGGVEDIF